MNIFFLHENPFKSAEMHCDKHVIKMSLESIQMLCTAHHLTGSIIQENPEIPKLYKSTHKNHPCSKWVRESIANYKWLALLAISLCEQYTIRYNKVIKSQSLCEHLAINYPMLPNLPLTPFPQAMPKHFKSDDPIHSYRLYYAAAKFRFAKWKNNPPEWWNKYRNIVKSENLEMINLKNDGI